jgi:Ca2+-binding RTX toxin-like protein
MKVGEIVTNPFRSLGLTGSIQYRENTNIDLEAMMAVINGTSSNNILNGTILNDEIYGLGGNDQLFGDRGNDSLFGGAGNDTLRGGVGEDQLDGGTGADNMNGGDGEDVYIVDNVGDVARESFDDGPAGERDVVYSSVTHTLGFGIEHLILTGIAAIDGTGNADSNLISGNDANNVLSGGDGTDFLRGNGGDDVLDGGKQNDVMDGGEGNDTYLVDQPDDIAEELSSGGVDTVSAYVTYRLREGIENLNLIWSPIFTTGIDGVGNGVGNIIGGNIADNELWGLDGNDTLNGMEGDDSLIGGTGADTLTGGLGVDTFIYNSVRDTISGANRDIITDFDGAGAGFGDVINLSGMDANALVAGNQAFTYIGNATFTAAGQLRYNTQSGILSGSTDADATSEFQILLVGIPALTVGGAGTDILL